MIEIKIHEQEKIYSILKGPNAEGHTWSW
jgi:hypothetical protein